MTTDYQSVGGVQFPLDASLVSDNLDVVADPARRHVLRLLKNALIAEIQDAFDVAKQGTTLDGYVVNMVCPFNPERSIHKSIPLKFPLMAAWRVQSEIVQHTMAYALKITDWELVYVIKDTGKVEMERFDSLKNAVENVIITTLLQTKHPAYNDGYSIMDDAGLWNVEVVRTNSVQWVVRDENSEINYPGTRILFRTHEKVYSDPPYVELENAQVSIDLENENEETLEDFVAAFDGYGSYLDTD